MREKLHIRLPGDEGPNPYDSRTQVTDLHKNQWLTSWSWWFSIIAMGVGITMARYFSNGGHF